MMEDTLIILDAIDAIWKKHKSQFQWWVMDIASRFRAKVIITCRSSIIEELQQNN
jgi:hypothetical protein